MNTLKKIVSIAIILALLTGGACLAYDKLFSPWSGPEAMHEYLETIADEHGFTVSASPTRNYLDGDTGYQTVLYNDKYVIVLEQRYDQEGALKKSRYCPKLYFEPCREHKRTVDIAIYDRWSLGGELVKEGCVKKLSRLRQVLEKHAVDTPRTTTATGDTVSCMVIESLVIEERYPNSAMTGHHWSIVLEPEAETQSITGQIRETSSIWSDPNNIWGEIVPELVLVDDQNLCHPLYFWDEGVFGDNLINEYVTLTQVLVKNWAKATEMAWVTTGAQSAEPARLIRATHRAVRKGGSKTPKNQQQVANPAVI